MNKERGSSKSIIAEPPLLIPPTLAAVVGLNEAILIQQIHFWLLGSEHIHDGKKWIYNSYTSWKKQFPFWSVSTIKRIVRSLEKQEIIESANFNKMKSDRTKWYTINYDKVDEIVEADNIPAPATVSDRPSHKANLTPPLPETTTETTTDIQSKALGNSHKVPPEPQPEKPQKPKATFSSKDNKKKDYSHEVIPPYKFTSISDYLAFPDVSYDKKCENLIKNRANLNRKEMVGILGDILIQHTVNAKEFLTATKGIKPVYPIIGRMLSEFPLEYLLYFCDRHRIPFKASAPWDRYFWGAVKREYAYWSADEEIARSQKVKEEEAKSLDELAEMIKDIKNQETTSGDKGTTA